MAGYVQLASADMVCKARKEQRVTVSVSETNVRYNHDRSQNQLDRVKHDTISPYGKEVRARVGGLTEGEVTLSQNVRVLQETFPRLNMGCLYLHSIEAKLHIKPVVYIAREFPKGSCMYDAILEHEKKHLQVDQEVVAKYRGLIEGDLKKQARSLPFSTGPYESGAIKSAQIKIQNYFQEIVKQYSKRMGEERRARQQAVDTLEEYESVQAQCEGKRE
jgi:hypothetical protein